MKKAAAAIALWAMVAVTATAADNTPFLKGGDPQAGQAASQQCAGCHGAKGNSPAAQFPNIAGQHAGYIFEQLQAFKAGTARKNPLMAGIVSGLSEQDMRNLAAYFSQQPHKIMGASDKDLVQRGQEIYLGGLPSQEVPACAACHGPRGLGNPGANYPVIGGQWPHYLEAQLHNFRSGARANDPQAVMRTVASRMSDDDIKAVAHYVSGLN